MDESSKEGDKNSMYISSLERTYIKMLERRITQLQTQLQEQGADRIKPTSTSNSGLTPDGDANQNGEEAVSDPKIRVRKVVSVWDHVTDTRQDVEKFDSAPKRVDESGTVFRRIMDPKDDRKLTDEELTVESKGLKDLLKTTLQHTSPHQFTAKKVTFFSPFNVFVWRWDEISNARLPSEADSQVVREAREDLREVLNLLESSDALGSYFSNRASHVAGATITFDYIWTLFPPGAMIYARPFMNEYQMFQVETSTTVDDESKGNTYFIYAYAFDWDGTLFRPYTYTFEVVKFEGTRSVVSLECFPVEYYHPNEDEDGSKLHKSLLRRGKHFVELCREGTFQYEYTGPLLAPPDPPLGLRTQTAVPKTLFLMESKVIVDSFSFLRSRRNKHNNQLPLGSKFGTNFILAPCPCDNCEQSTVVSWKKEIDNPQFSRAEELLNETFGQSEERLLLCPPRLLGYSLQLKEWCQMLIGNVKMIDPNMSLGSDTYFDNQLEMENGDKKLLKAMIQSHISTSDKYMSYDVVEGKGRGLVILLHGPPGVGKTLTAETIALASQRPLMSVSTAEIGISPELAESNLRAIFEDASRWKAVLHIDEADRNALVAVLLRVLEYYEGIIILTTNRIMSLDVAVESRIHLAIQYHDLTREQMQKIFDYFLRKVEESRIADRDSIHREVSSMVKRTKLNGRQIRNIVMAWLLLAAAEKSKLKPDHIETAMDATHKFMESLKDSSRSKRSFNEAPTD